MKGQVRGHLRGIDRQEASAFRRTVNPFDPRVRMCAFCGQRGPVRLDPEGGWAWCSACGRPA